MKIYHFYSKTTGEIVESFSDVIKAVFTSLIHYHFWNVQWSYSKQGF